MKENSRRGNILVKANTFSPMAVSTPENGSRDNTMVSYVLFCIDFFLWLTFLFTPKSLFRVW